MAGSLKQENVLPGRRRPGIRAAGAWIATFTRRGLGARVRAAAEPRARSPLLPAAAGAVAFFATLSLSIPVVPLLTALVVVNRARWRSIALAAALGSASAGALFAQVVGRVGASFVQARLPELAAWTHAQHTVDWVSRYGMITLAAIAALPVAQSPALVLFGLLGMPWYHVFAALLLGKVAKYGLLAAVTSGSASRWADTYEMLVRASERDEERPGGGVSAPVDTIGGPRSPASSGRQRDHEGLQ